MQVTKPWCNLTTALSIKADFEAISDEDIEEKIGEKRFVRLLKAESAPSEDFNYCRS